LGLKIIGCRSFSSRPLSLPPLLVVLLVVALVVVVVSSEPAGAPARGAPLNSPRVGAGVRDSAGRQQVVEIQWQEQEVNMLEVVQKAS
jgi:hypothetical protein